MGNFVLSPATLLKTTLMSFTILSQFTACPVSQINHLQPQKKANLLSQLSDLVQSEYGKNINVPPLPDNIKQDFAYNANAKIVSLSVKEDKDNWTVFSGKLSARDQAHVRNDPTLMGNPAGDYFINFSFHYSKKAVPGGNPLIVQIPALGSAGGPESIISEGFASLGYHSLLVMPDHGASAVDQPIDQVHKYFIRNTVAVQQALDFVLSVNNLDPSKVDSSLDPLLLAFLQTTFRSINSSRILGSGISMGGIRMGYLLAVEPRIVKGVILMGGGDLANIIATSKEPSAIDYQNRKIQELLAEKKIPDTCTFSDNEQSRQECNQKLLENYLRGIIKYDNLTLSQYVKSKRVGMVISESDNVVPTEDQLKLWNGFGQPSFKLLTYSFYNAQALANRFSFLSSADKKKITNTLNHWYSNNPTGHFDLVFVISTALRFVQKEFELGLLLK